MMKRSIIRKTVSALALTFASFTASVANASNFQPAHVPEGAVWYGHLDVDRTLTSTLGKLATDRLSEQEKIRIRIFSRMFGFSLLEDLRSVTLFGMPAHPDAGVLILEGNFDRDYLVDLVSVNEGYSTFSHRDRTVHHWIDEKKGKASYGVFANAGTLMLTDSKELIRTALDTMDGGHPSLPQGALEGVPKSMTEAALVVGVANFGGIAGLEPDAAILQEIVSGHLAAAEVSQNLEILFNLEVATDESAVKLQRMVDGLLAFASLNREKPGLDRLASAFAVDRTGRQVKGVFSFPVEELVEILQNLR